MLKQVKIYIYDNLVLGDIAIGLDDGRNPGGHRLSESLEILSVLSKFLPSLLDILGQLIKVRGSRIGGNNPLETSPLILDRI